MNGSHKTQRFDAREQSFITKVWQDREIRFDVSPSLLRPDVGKKLIPLIV